MRHERRRHPRLEIPLEVQLLILGSDRELSVTMEDLSAGGAGLLTTFEIPVGTQIQRLVFELPAVEGGEPTPIELAARVARTEREERIGGEQAFHIGLQFVDITRELFDRIQRFVFQRLRSDEQKRVPIERPIAIRFDRFDDFVDEVSMNLSATGMFIRTRDPRPPGAVFNFQFQLGDDFSLIEGRAEVVWRRRHQEGPDKPPGMGVRFLNLDVSSQRLIERLISQRGEEVEEPAVPWDELSGETADPEAPAPPATEGTPAPPGGGGPATGSRLAADSAEAVDPGRVAALKAVAGKLKEDLDSARRAHGEELEALRARLADQHAAARSELEERLRDAEGTHKELDRQRADLETARQDLQNRVDELLATTEELRRRTEELQQRLDQSAAPEEVERLNDQRAAVEQERDQARRELAEARLEIEKLERELDHRPATDELQRLVNESGALAATNTRLLADLDRANDEADELRQQLADRSAEREVQRLTEEQSELEAAHHELQAAHDEARQVAASAEAELRELRAELDLRPSEEQLQQLEGERAELETARQALEAERDQARHEGDELRAEIERLAAAASEQQERSRQEADEAHRLRESAETAARETGGELEALREELAAAHQQREALDEELEAVRGELSMVHERHETLAEELEVARQELSALRAGQEESAPATEGDEGRATDDESDADLAEARDESERLRRELSAVEESRAQLAAELDQVRDEARQASLEAETRELALRAEVENSSLAAASDAPAATRHGSGRRTLGIAALILVGALLGILAATFLLPLDSLSGWRPAERPVEVARGGGPAPVPSVAATPEEVADDTSEPTATPLSPPEAGAAEPPVAEPPVAEPPVAGPAPLPEPPPGADLESAEQAVLSWALAWSEQRVDDYLASYARSYQPPDGQDRAEWAATRRQRIERPRSIEVTVESARTVELAPDRVSVSFDQAYASDTFSDRVRKTLIMVPEDGSWKIAEERVIE